MNYVVLFLSCVIIALVVSVPVPADDVTYGATVSNVTNSSFVVTFEPKEAHLARRSSHSSSSSSYSSSSSSQNDDSIEFLLAFTTIETDNENVIADIVTTVWRMVVLNHTQIHDRRRGAYYYDTTGSNNCATTCTVSYNQSTLGGLSCNTACSDSGRITYYCFPSGASVYVQNPTTGTIGNVQMMSLYQQYNNNITSYDADTKEMTVSHLVGFPHHDMFVTIVFLQITTSLGFVLEISDNHIMFAVDLSCTQDPSECMIVPMFAKEMIIGDTVVTFDGQIQSYDYITSIRRVLRTGVYAPMTEDGMPFFVNGILVSPFSSTMNSFKQMVYYYYSVYGATFPTSQDYVNE